MRPRQNLSRSNRRLRNLKRFVHSWATPKAPTKARIYLAGKQGLDAGILVIASVAGG
jgi:hypothetical protein